MIRMTMVSAALTVIVFSGPAFAQGASDAAQSTTAALNDNSSGASANSGVGMDMNGRSDAGVPAGLTRAEVRQDLIQSERDGQLARLNSTLYVGGR